MLTTEIFLAAYNQVECWSFFISYPLVSITLTVLSLNYYTINLS